MSETLGTYTASDSSKTTVEVVGDNPCPVCHPRPPKPLRPRIVCLCGSTRFTDIMLVKQWELTKQGYITLSWCALPKWYYSGDHIGDVEGVKEIVDELHLRKIDLADEVFVINVGGYVGESTSRELAYARQQGKPIRWLEAEHVDP